MHLDLTSSGIFRLSTELAAIIGTGTDQLSLDDAIILINSEFGRSIDKDPGGGRNHWPDGYVATVIGGPVRARGIAGALDLGGMPATVPGASATFTPTDLRGAMLLAAGIDPFAPENFAVQDFSDAVSDGTEKETRVNLRRNLLGIA